MKINCSKLFELAVGMNVFTWYIPRIKIKYSFINDTWLDISMLCDIYQPNKFNTNIIKFRKI